MEETKALQPYETEDGIEIVVNMENGETFATQRGYARMSGKNQSTVSRRCKGDAKKSLKTATIPTQGGLQGDATLIPEDTILDWLAKDNPALLTSFAKLGLRKTLHKWAGIDFEQPKPPEQKPLPAKEQFELAKQCAEFWEQLGLLDDRDRLFLKDFTRNAIAQSNQNFLTEARQTEIAISNRVIELGYKADNGILKSIGHRVSREYKKLKGEAPPKRQQWVDGAPRQVNTYFEEDLPLIDSIIHTVFRDRN